VHSWSTFGAWMSRGQTRTSHGQTQIHKTHHDLDLGEATTFLLIVFSMLGHEACTQMSFCLKTPKLGVLKISKLGLLRLWKPITFFAKLRLKWGLKQSCSLCQELFNNMRHVSYIIVNQGDSWFLMVGSQIGSLIRDPSFGHNFCFKYPNGSCEPSLNIYVPRDFAMI
jgi:hypothetical protein